MKTTPGLVKRGGVYYARKRVPKLLVEKLGEAEIKESLQTKVYAEARALLPAALERIQRKIAAEAVDRGELLPMRPRLRVPDSILDDLAIARFVAKWAVAEPQLFEPIREDRAGDEIVEIIDEDIAAITSERDDAFGPYVTDAQKKLESAGYGNANDVSVKRLAGFLRRADLQILVIRRRHYVQRDVSHAFTDPLFLRLNPGALVSVSERPRTDHSTTIGEAIDRFRSDPQRGGLSPKSASGYQQAFALLREIVGSRALVASVTREHVRRIAEMLSRLPPNATKRFPKMTLKEAADHATQNGLAAVERKTADNVLANLSAFFRWAEDEGLIAKSPTNGIRATQKPKRKDDLRQPFSSSQLSALFKGDVFDGLRGRSTTASPGRYWIPLLALYQGARCNELCQLEVGDIQVVDEMPRIRISEDSLANEEKHLKTASAERVIPIHPAILRLGFLAYVLSMKNLKVGRLFPDLTKAKTGYYSDNFSKWFSRYRKGRGVMDTRVSFHSFRHNFRDACRAVGISDRIAQELGGWSVGGAIDARYGAGHGLGQKLNALSKIAYPSVEVLFPLLGVNDMQKVNGTSADESAKEEA